MPEAGCAIPRPRRIGYVRATPGPDASSIAPHIAPLTYRSFAPVTISRRKMAAHLRRGLDVAPSMRDPWRPNCLGKNSARGDRDHVLDRRAVMTELIHHYGAWVVFILVFLEAVGLPFPGETILVTAAIYAGTTQNLSIGLVLFAAVAGATLGSIIGFWIGDRYGYPLL